MCINLTQACRFAAEMKKQSGYPIEWNDLVRVKDDGTMIAYAYCKGDVLVTGFGCHNNSTVKVKVSCY